MMKITRYFLSNKYITGKYAVNGILSLLFLFSFTLSAQGLNLEDAEQIALKSDPAKQIYQSQQSALIAQGLAASTLADPMIKIGTANVPTDSFSFNQEPMTQLSLGLSQQFSRGNQLELNQKSFNLESEVSVFQALDRKLQVKQRVRQRWFAILFIEKSLQIVKNNKQLFGSFYRDLQSQFSLGLTENEDLLAAEIELNKFDEKIAGLVQQLQRQRSLLSEWIGQAAYDDLSTKAPIWAETLNYIKRANNKHYSLLIKHPMVKERSLRILVADNRINVAEQSFKPSFKVDVGYGRRLDNRADLLSAFVSLDIPLFTGNRQDQKLISAQQIKGKTQAEYRLLLRKLNAQLTAEIVNYQQLVERQQRYKKSLLKQAKLQVKLLEQSYQSNTRPFQAVIDAYIYEQNLSLEYQKLYFDGLKSLANIRYFQAL